MREQATGQDRLGNHIEPPAAARRTLTVKRSIVAEAGLRFLCDKLVAAFALSFADMHLSPTFGARLTPSGRSRLHRDHFFRRLPLGFFESLFVRLNLGTLRVNPSRRVGNLPADRTDFALR